MCAFGAAIGRRVWYNHDGVRRLYPMLNLLLIGPSGIGKSYSIDLGVELLNELHFARRPQLIHGSTPEKLHSTLAENPHGVLIASELANFFNKQKYMESMIPYVTELLDYRPVERRTVGGGLVRVEEPAVTVIGGSTVEWLQDQLPDSAGAGGFLARFFICKEEYKGRKDGLPLFVARTEREQREALRSRALREFPRYVEAYAGEFGWYDWDVAESYSFWYANHRPETGFLSPFSARAGEFVIRLAMIVAMSCGHSGIMQDDLDCAFVVYNLMVKKLQTVVVAFTPQGKMLEKILQALAFGPRTEVELRRAMRNFCSSRDVDALVTSLLASNDIYKTNTGSFARTLYKGS